MDLCRWKSDWRHQNPAYTIKQIHISYGTPQCCYSFSHNITKVQLPRLSYLPVLLPRLHAFFQPQLISTDVIPYDGWFSYEDVPLKWQYQLGLLHDLFSGAPPYQARKMELNAESDEEETHSYLPWRLMVHFTEWPEHALVRPDAEGKVLHDAFINAVKEADFLRNGTAKGIMSLSKKDSTALWNAVQQRETHS